MTTVEPDMTWSPEKSSPVPASSKHRWLEAWPRCVDGVDGELAGFEAVAVAEQPVGSERGVVGFEVDMVVRGRRTEGEHLGAGCLLQADRKRRVVDVGVGDEDPAQPVAGRLQQSGQMVVVVGPGVDEGQAFVAEQVGVGPRAGHEAGIGGDDPGHPRGNFYGPARLQLLGPAPAESPLGR